MESQRDCQHSQEHGNQEERIDIWARLLKGDTIAQSLAGCGWIIPVCTLLLVGHDLVGVH